MSNRIRLVGWNVQPVIMSDDGENLTPLSINMQHIPANLWQQFKDGGDQKALDDIRAQVESQGDAMSDPEL